MVTIAELWQNKHQEDSRGSIDRYYRDDGTAEARVFTRKGFFRGGEVHLCDQSHVILSGKACFTTYENGEDVERIYHAGDIVEIPAGVPHLFEALEDTVFTEVYHGEFDGSTYYQRYRDIVAQRMVKKE